MMRPQRIDLWEIELPLIRPFINANDTYTSRRSVIAMMRSGGHRGWAEAPIVPGHTRDTSSEAYDLMISEAGRLILAEEPLLIEGSAGTSGLDAARFALQAHSEDRSLVEAAGGSTDGVLASLAIGLTESTDELIEQVSIGIDMGYHHVKLKMTPKTLPRLARVRTAFPKLGIAIDGNGSFRRQHIGELVALETLGLTYIEQPLATLDINGHAPLQAQTSTIICLDESIRRLGDIITAASVGAARAVSLKPGRLGPTLTQRAITLAVRQGLEIKMGGLIESDIGKVHLMAQASNPNVTLPSDLAPSGYWFETSLTSISIEIVDGLMIPVNDRGLDRLIDREALRELAIRHARVPD